MITLLPFLGALCGGIVTCVLTLVFGPWIQHGFWTR
jgi:hypothetical protein